MRQPSLTAKRVPYGEIRQGLLSPVGHILDAGGQINLGFVVLIQVCGAWTVVAGGRFRSAALQIYNSFIGVTRGVGSGNAH